MPIPTFSIHISGKAVAWYGATLSTITTTAQIIAYLRDRANIRIGVQHGIKIINDRRYANKAITLINISNNSRKPVTVTSIGGQHLYPGDRLIFDEVSIPPPCELTEGKPLTAFVEEEKLQPVTIESYWVSTATGKTFRKNVAPWRQRWVSRYRRRRHWRREGKAQEATRLSIERTD